MKSITESINEARNKVFSEVQADSNNKAAYSSIDISEASKKYKHGFLQIDGESVYLTSFNDVDDIKDLLSVDDDQPYITIAYAMKPLEHKMIDGTMIVKLW